MLDWFETPNEFGVVTEYAQGELFEILEEDKKMNEEQIRQIAIQLGQALHYLHKNRIIHRDMKPQNILIGGDGVMKLCDFGFARAMSSSTVVLTSIKGTPLYMAPELVQERPYNHSVDLWSFGIILYELFCGKPPFFTNQLCSLIKLIVKKSVKYPSEMSKNFRGFLEGLLVKEPEKRMKWGDILDHPFLRKTNLDVNKEKVMLVRYGEWMRKLASWNPDFKEFKSEKENELMHNNSFVSISNNSELNLVSFHDLLVNAKNDYHKVEKDKLNYIKKMLSNLSSKVKRGCPPDISKDNLLDVLFILDNIREKKDGFSFLKKFSRKYTRFLKKIYIGLCKGNFKGISILFKFLRNAIFFCDKNSFEEILVLVIKKLKSIKSLSEKSFISLLWILVEILDFYYKDLSLISKFTLIIKKTEIWKFAFSNNFFKTEFLENEKTIEVIAMIFSPKIFEIIPFPILKEKNISNLGTNLKETHLQTLIEFEEYIHFQVFSCLERKNWLSFVDISNIFYLKIILRYLRFSEECILQFISKQKLSKELQHTAESIAHKSEELQELFLLIYTEINKTKLKFISISKNDILEIFSKKEHPYLQFLLLNYTTSMMSDPNFLSQFFNSKKKFSKFLKKFFDFTKIYMEESIGKNWETLYKDELKNSGFIKIGFMDPVIKFLRYFLLQARKSKDLLIEFIMELTNKNLHNLLFNLFEKLDKNYLISMKGLILITNLVVELLTVTKEHLLFVEILTKEKILKCLLLFISESKLQASLEWPLKLGGNGVFDAGIKSSVLRIIEIILSTLLKNKKPKLYKPLINQIKTFPRLIKKVLKIYQSNLKDLKKSTKTDKNKKTAIRMTFIVLLMKIKDLEKSIVQQFCKNKGPDFILQNGGLDLSPENPSNQIPLQNHLSILTQITYNSTQNYPLIHNLHLYKPLKKLMISSTPTIREKCCRLLGQMCKQSPYFYQHIKKHKIVENLLFLCKDEYSVVRKAACLALGNAAFYNDGLYEQFEKGVPVIAKLFRDKDDKIRTNAVGTINNFTRNSKRLYKSVIACKVPALLYKLWKNDPALVF